MKYEIKSWRKENDPKPEFGKEFPFEPTTRIFDQLTFIGDPIVSCFLLETEAGLILIDAMEPEHRYLDAIVKGINDIGYDITDLKVILITHGHGDHFGMAGKLRELSGAKIYMNKIDYKMASTRKTKRYDPIDYPMDGYLTDGQEFTFGGTTIKCVLTPGHTQGCMSFIIPVTDEGRPHNIALWGGTGLNPGVNIYQYLLSVEKFSKICDEYNVEGAISNHPPCDNGVLRAKICREIVDGVPNPYVMTHEEYKRFENRYRRMAERVLPRSENGIAPCPPGFPGGSQK